MKVRPLPKKWLIHDIIYECFTGRKDDWGKPVYEDPVIIKFVRFDESTVFSRDTTQNKIVAEGIIFVDAVNSSPIPIFKEDSRITFNGRKLTLKKIVTLYQPKSNEIRHWELEVI